MIVTMCKPTDFMLQRSIRYQKFRSNTFDVWYIFDVTANYKIPEFYLPYFEKNIYSFNSSDYHIKHPDMMDLINNCARIKTVKKGLEYKYLPYLSTTERVNELYQQQKFETDYIWIIEQDSAITGNLTKIMEIFDKSEADLVARRITKSAYIYDKGNVSNWKFSQCLSEKAKILIKNKPISLSCIFFTNISIKLMNHLNSFYSSGYHGMSEAILPTVAILNNLITMEFPSNMVYRNSHTGTLFIKEEYNKLKNTEMFAHRFKE